MLLQSAAALWSFLVFCHFCADWLWQSHEQAEAKKNDPWVRWSHCLGYTTWMTVPVWLVLGGDPLFFVCLLLLLFSHYIGDGYKITLWWAKRVRRIPEDQMTPAWPMTVVLFVVVDQIWHLAWLWVPAILGAWISSQEG